MWSRCITISAVCLQSDYSIRYRQVAFVQRRPTDRTTVNTVTKWPLYRGALLVTLQQPQKTSGLYIEVPYWSLYSNHRRQVAFIQRYLTGQPTVSTMDKWSSCTGCLAIYVGLLSATTAVSSPPCHPPQVPDVHKGVSSTSSYRVGVKSTPI